jgi:type IV pilus assembly protein PilC
MVIGLSRFMQDWWWACARRAGRSDLRLPPCASNLPGFSRPHGRWLLKLPLVGTLMYKSAVARFARTLSTTFAAGVPLVEALDSVAGATGNIVFKRAVMRIKQDVSTGMQLNFSMRTSGVFPNMAVQMTAIGEESGALDDMLDKVAGFYEDEVDNMVDNLTSLMEPFIMVVLGVIVGGLVIAMYLPIFQLGSAI